MVEPAGCRELPDALAKALLQQIDSVSTRKTRVHPLIGLSTVFRSLLDKLPGESRESIHDIQPMEHFARKMSNTDSVHSLSSELSFNFDRAKFGERWEISCSRCVAFVCKRPFPPAAVSRDAKFALAILILHCATIPTRYWSNERQRRKQGNSKAMFAPLMNHRLHRPVVRSLTLSD